ncbi:hypothetical protein C5167_038406, partial [Papaver somniferum]
MVFFCLIFIMVVVVVGKSHFWCWWCCNMIFGGGGGKDFGAGEVMVVAFRTKYWDINNAYASSSICCREYKLEDFISVDEIRRMKSLQMGHFETRRRTILGDNEYVKQTDRTK